MDLNQFIQEKTALVIGHPTHELRIYHWLSVVKPYTCILTRLHSDHLSSHNFRLNASKQTLSDLNISCGPVIGRYPERMFFQSILQSQYDFFYEIAETLLSWVQYNNITHIVGDAYEGFNPIHDICRYIIDAVVAKAKHKNYKLCNYSIMLIDDPVLRCFKDQLITLPLSAEDMKIKKRQVSNYYGLQEELDNELPHEGWQTCSTEYLCPINIEFSYPDFNNERPFYEKHGEKKVKAGKYKQVIYYKQHMHPIQKALEKWVLQ